MLLSLTNAHSYAALTIPLGPYNAGQGKVWSGNFNSSAGPGSAAFVNPTSISQPWGGYVTHTKPSIGGFNSCVASSLFNKLSNQNVTGLRLAEDVLLVIEAGTITGNHKIWADDYIPTTYSPTATFASTGLFSSNNSRSTTPWCVGNQYSASYPGARLEPTLKRATLNGGRVALYIGPNAPSRSITIPALYFGIRVNTDFDTILNTSSIRISPPTSCTVGFQDQNIHFGNVNNVTADNQVLATESSKLNIQCPVVNDGGNGTNRVTLKLAFAGEPGRSTDTLALKDSNGSILAEIRGDKQLASGNCSITSSSQVLFNNVSSNIANVAVGTTEIPLTWTLCSNGLRQYGSGTAQAVATVSWP
ncbi:hypothetical protein [Serratia microhaemolytica]|uniref:hypothetical protein n=1 Tax=Serratia microhaemolytica TaxID=2675110 RepID=UPI000FDEB4D5|nr:hypothetical protein [Serratia microhaemolytica]